MAAAESSPAPCPDDPDAPYFEHLYAALRGQRSDLTRAEALEILREIDPDDALRISLPQAADTVRGPVSETGDDGRFSGDGVTIRCQVVWSSGRGG
jgi:hypothetical protein